MSSRDEFDERSCKTVDLVVGVLGVQRDAQARCSHRYGRGAERTHVESLLAKPV